LEDVMKRYLWGLVLCILLGTQLFSGEANQELESSDPQRAIRVVATPSSENKALLPELLNACKEKNELIRTAAIRKLTSIGGWSRNEVAMLGVLTESSPLTACAAVDALALLRKDACESVAHGPAYRSTRHQRPILEHYGTYASIHSQIRDLPDGTQVVINVKK